MKTDTQAKDNRAAVADGAAAIGGLTGARVYMRLGQYVSAINHLQQVNPWMMREQAKTIVDSFGYHCGDADDEDELVFTVRSL